ncbi:MAG TPA: hypothetical protein VFG30_23985 [Polyangiales bacterium]|nr:hypothetical protein [Polyangiales bacterium]
MKPAAADHPGVALGPAFVASLGLLRQRLVVLPALGAAIVFSILSVCCGIGLFTTPWFICELFATQLALCTGKPALHSVSWVPAGLILIGAVLLVMSTASLTLLGAGPDLPPNAAPLSGLGTLMRSGGFYAAISSTLALLFMMPVLYAPLVLIDRRADFEEALLESVRIVVRRGVLASLTLSLVVHVVQISPLLLASAWALWGTRSTVPQALLIATPLLCITIPLGQGMVTWIYTHFRADPTNPTTSPAGLPHTPRTEAALLTISRWVRVWTFVVVLPIAAVVGVGLSLVRPSALSPGNAPRNGELIADLVPLAGQTKRAALDNTSLELSVSPEQLAIAAADGGGTGELTLHDSAPITRVRVIRVRDAFAIEVLQGELSSSTWIDRAGVRLDDDLRARLMDRVSGRELAFVLLFPFVAALLTVPVLNRLSRVQLAVRKFGDRRPSDDVLDLALRRSVRRTQLFIAVILPLDGLALALAVRALGWV